MADLQVLRDRLHELGEVVVAFSGGADSSFLAWVAHDTLGPERATAVTAVSPSLAGLERDDCRALAEEWGLSWREVETDEMANAAYRRNDVDRCFWCKDALMDAVEPIVAVAGATVALGVNIDDLDDHRPGQEAARQRGAVFPLVEAGFTKDDVRAWSRELGLRTWDKPAAPCLASRLPYGIPVTLGRLRSVEQAESALRAMGFAELRVRHHDELARVEVPADRLGDVVHRRDEVLDAVRAAGYRWVTLDLAGLRSGNLNPGDVRWSKADQFPSVPQHRTR
ncbi:MAG TPA: ATP-dependent sacrificial sulfur transferase LarE [Acidimicrobiales bacterium]|nr:ATP-dependent sacrificial sulfur transferase LarE [Acidimicrobiales bacterium]